MTTRIPARELGRYLIGLYRSAGMSPSAAAGVAAAQVEADLRGLTGHGSRLAPSYLRKLRSGDLNPRPRIRVETERGSCVALLHGDGAPGPLAAGIAVRTAARGCREHGVGLVAARGVGHAGAVGVFASRAARHGLIGIVATQTSAASVALLGGTGLPVLGNCAVAVAVPGPDPRRPVLLDMAMGALSWGTVHHLGRHGQPLPPGVALDRHGHPTVRAGDAAVLLGDGGRGQALALLTEVLVAAVTGSPLPRTGQDERGLVCLVIDPGRISRGDDLAGVARLAHTVRGQGARLPGDRAWSHRDAAAASGLALADLDVCALLAAHPTPSWLPLAFAAHRTRCPACQDIHLSLHP
ncbi:Ldh family oxidoreductase [Umezawaea sp. Da 62-37]|uniref:Ldh family oxidoreductase n=1 Tax=Umezawaea sp. Da 62-37 TaxID=3075927 RepID=UPI0028F6C78C|nr:Ldh family oxidoreductase [Umezawaea sp. Da 62-37]WNV84738.1 Ldh family oxidoreductase [Umezawaea sp. Da 62-37]